MSEHTFVKDLVSIIIPTYNRRNWIGECLNAVKAQTYPYLETIIVDDGSSDGTVEWLRAEPRYQFAKIHEQKNSGASAARNTGVKLSTGEFITYIDSDDVLEPHHIQTAVETFRKYPKLGLFCCDALMIDAESRIMNEGRTWHEMNSVVKNYPVKSGLRCLEDIFLFSNCFPGFTLRREVFDKVGYLDQSIFPLDDYDFALRVAGSGYEVYYCHQALARYRNHGGNSSGAANGIKVAEEKLRCLQIALTRNPELKNLGEAAKHRIAEVQTELAVSCFYAGKMTAAGRAVVQAISNDIHQLTQVAKLGKNWLAKRVSALS
ncbi:MAG: glycosyltransferase [Acidobacteriota bacterium]